MQETAGAARTKQTPPMTPIGITAIRAHALKKGDLFIINFHKSRVTSIEDGRIYYRWDNSYESISANSQQWVELLSPFNMRQQPFTTKFLQL